MTLTNYLNILMITALSVPLTLFIITILLDTITRLYGLYIKNRVFVIRIFQDNGRVTSIRTNKRSIGLRYEGNQIIKVNDT